MALRVVLLVEYTRYRVVLQCARGTFSLLTKKYPPPTGWYYALRRKVRRGSPRKEGSPPCLLCSNGDCASSPTLNPKSRRDYERGVSLRNTVAIWVSDDRYWRCNCNANIDHHGLFVLSGRTSTYSAPFFQSDICFC